MKINYNEAYTLDELEKTISEKNKSNDLIQYAEEKDIEENAVINHMPYNSGLFFNTLEDESFYLKSLEEDMIFADKVFG